MDTGLDFLRRAVREAADRLDALLRRLEAHRDAPADERLQQWARPSVPALSRELDSLRAYAEELGTTVPSALARSVTGAVAEAASAVLGGGVAASYETLADTLRAASDVQARLDVLRHAGDTLKNARLTELSRSLGPEVGRLLREGEPLARQLFVERARPQAAG
jgi:hypothetical protein